MVITFPSTVTHHLQDGQVDLEFDFSTAQLVLVIFQFPGKGKQKFHVSPTDSNLTEASKNLGVDPFRDHVGHFGYIRD